MMKPKPYDDRIHAGKVMVPAVGSNVVHRFGRYDDGRDREYSACGLLWVEGWRGIEGKFLNPDTTRPCARCWEVKQ